MPCRSSARGDPSRRRRAAPAHRPLGHAAAARRGGALPGRRRRATGPARAVGRARRVRSRCPAIVDTSQKKRLDLTIEVPVEDMARSASRGHSERPGVAGTGAASIWTAIHPRLLELIRAHRSTLIFVNSRRIAERLASALNELAGETLVRSHHGSVARPQRIEVEDRLKAGLIRGLVATSSLELGIDMGAIDLVIQIEAPPSVASGMQRIGRAGTRSARPAAASSCRSSAAISSRAPPSRARCTRRRSRATRYPRNPLDVLAQQIVAMVAMDDSGTSTTSSTLCGARRRSPSSAAASSRACSTCCPAAIRPTTSPIFGRG